MSPESRLPARSVLLPSAEVSKNPPPTPAGAKAPRRLLTASLAPIKRACWSFAPFLIFISVFDKYAEKNLNKKTAHSETNVPLSKLNYYQIFTDTASRLSGSSFSSAETRNVNFVSVFAARTFIFCTNSAKAVKS